MLRRKDNSRMNRTASRSWSGVRCCMQRAMAIASLGWFAIVSVGVPQHLGWPGATISNADCRCDPARKRAGQCCCRLPDRLRSANPRTAKTESRASAARPCCSALKVKAVASVSLVANDRSAARERTLDLATCVSKPPAPCCSKQLTPRSERSTVSATGLAMVDRVPAVPVDSQQGSRPCSEGTRRQSLAIDGCGCGGGGPLPGLVQNQDPRVGGTGVSLVPTLLCIGWIELPVETSPIFFAFPPVPPPRLDAV